MLSKKQFIALTVIAMSAQSAFASHRMPRPDHLIQARDVSLNLLQTGISLVNEIDQMQAPAPGMPRPANPLTQAAVQAERDAHELYHSIAQFARGNDGTPVNGTPEQYLDQALSSEYQLSQVAMHSGMVSSARINQLMGQLSQDAHTLDLLFSPWNDARDTAGRLSGSAHAAAEFAMHEKQQRDPFSDLRTQARMNAAVTRLNAVAQQADQIRAMLAFDQPNAGQVMMALRQLETAYQMTGGILSIAAFSSQVTNEFSHSTQIETELAGEVAAVQN